jgi:RND family efflux transporter MFP subunit
MSYLPLLADVSRTARRRLRPWFLVLAAVVGCGKPPAAAKPVDVDPHVRLVKAELRTISRTVGQPGFIYAYEQTAIFPQVAGSVKKWHVDIGDSIKKDQEIATLSVPDLDAQLLQKKAQVELDEAQVLVAERMVEVATNNVRVAAAHVDEVKAGVNKFLASMERWESEVKRLTGLAEQGVVDKQVLDESRKQLKSETAARDAANATVVAAEATQLARKSDLDKAQADVVAARAKAQVSREDAKRVAALVGYTHITAPYAGIVVTRNANTGDYLQPGSGDQSVSSVAPGQSGAHVPLYVVARIDRIRVYVDVPEMDAGSVMRGTKARVRVQALRDEEISAEVTRTSGSLHRETRTLRAEIDLPNPDSRLRPGMYAYANVLIHHNDVRALPLAAVVELGNQNCCYLYEDGKAVQTPVQIGISDGKWVEATKKRVGGTWTDFTGEEEVILCDLSELTDGQTVKVVKAAVDPQ